MRAPALKISIPNLLTLFRILLTPAFVILLLRGDHLYALVVFTLAGVTDGLDGFIARVFDQRTELGAVIDPIADKALLLAAVVTLSVKGLMPSWLAVIVVSRDLMILAGIAIFALKDIAIKIRPSMVSKITTAAQLCAVFATLAGTRWPEAAMMQNSLYWSVAILTVASGLHYVYVGLAILQGDRDGVGRVDEG